MRSEAKIAGQEPGDLPSHLFLHLKNRLKSLDEEASSVRRHPVPPRRQANHFLPRIKGKKRVKAQPSILQTKSSGLRGQLLNFAFLVFDMLAGDGIEFLNFHFVRHCSSILFGYIEMPGPCRGIQSNLERCRFSHVTSSGSRRMAGRTFEGCTYIVALGIVNFPVLRFAELRQSRVDAQSVPARTVCKPDSVQRPSLLDDHSSSRRVAAIAQAAYPDQ